MGRPRSSLNQLPKYVYLAKSRYVWKPYDYENKRFVGEYVLGPKNMSVDEVWRAFDILSAESDFPKSWMKDMLRSCRSNAKARKVPF
jgi:hypothetical protein